MGNCVSGGSAVHEDERGAKYLASGPATETNGKAKNGQPTAVSDSAVRDAVDVKEAEPVKSDSASKSPAKGSDANGLELMSAQGFPHKTHLLGPPVPACDEQRLKTMLALDLLDAPPDPELESILKLVQSIFKTKNALVALFGDKRIFITDAVGVFKRGDFAWRWSFCAWTMAQAAPKTMIIEDTHKDARFCDNAMVRSPVGPGVRFYAGSPLIASNGQVLGTICFAEDTPREFDQSQCVILNNLAEMVVRHVEKDMLLQLKQQDNKALKEAYGQLKRAMDAFDHCVVLVDVSAKGWKIMYVNEAWSKLTGTKRERLVDHLLCEVMELPSGGVLPGAEHTEAAGASKEFTIGDARITRRVWEEEVASGGQPAQGMSGSVSQMLSGANTISSDESNVQSYASNTTSKHSLSQKYVLKFRPAYGSNLEGNPGVGVPSFLSPESKDETTRHFYFMTVAKPERKRLSLTSGNSTVDFGEQPIEGLDVGRLLGRGAYGSVYLGTWFGTVVAVKVVDQDVRTLDANGGISLEAIFGAELRHPHVVQTLKYAVRRRTTSKPPAAPSTGKGSQGLGSDGGTGPLHQQHQHQQDTIMEEPSQQQAKEQQQQQQQQQYLSGRTSGNGEAKGSSGAGQQRPSATFSDDTAASGPFTSSTPGANSDNSTTTAAPPQQQAGRATGAVGAGGGADGNAWAVIDYGVDGRTESLTSDKPGMSLLLPPVSTDNSQASGAPTDGARAATADAVVADPHVCAPAGFDSFNVADSSCKLFAELGKDSRMLGAPNGSSATGTDSGSTGPANGNPLAGVVRRGKAKNASGPQEMAQTWIVLEYCDKGCLQDAVDKGWLQDVRSCVEGMPCWEAVMATAFEIASALHYLHRHDIIHGDLSAWNVMLSSAGNSAAVAGRNFVAKIADFGLARSMDVVTKIQTCTYGTITHMPPETLVNGTITKLVDVYSFGVLLWQMCTGSRPWAGLSHGQIIMRVATQSAQLQWPGFVPAGLAELGKRCLAFAPEGRPAMEVIVKELEDLKRTL